MAGFSDLIFGKAPESKVTGASTLTREQEDLLGRLIAELGVGTSVTKSGTAYTPYTGDLVAGTSNLENLSLTALEQAIMNRVQGTDITSTAARGTADLIAKGGAPVSPNDYFDKSIRDPALRDFRENILPDLTRKYRGSEAFGSDRMLAESQATGRLNDTLVGSRADLNYRSQSDAANRLVQALGLGATLGQADIANVTNMESAAGLPRQIEQAKKTAAYQEFIRQQEQQKANQDTRLNAILAALGIKAKENIATTTGGSSGLLGTALTAAATYFGGPAAGAAVGAVTKR